jgi:hypothetical protein
MLINQQITENVNKRQAQYYRENCYIVVSYELFAYEVNLPRYPIYRVQLP